jgi:hypothetical protein
MKRFIAKALAQVAIANKMNSPKPLRRWFRRLPRAARAHAARKMRRDWMRVLRVRRGEGLA